MIGLKNILLMAVLLATGLIAPVQAQDTLYDSQHPILKCTMQYPLAWKLQIIDGAKEKYTAFELTGPENSAGTYHAHINISASTPKDAGYGTAVEYFDAFLEKAKTLTSRYELLKRGNISYWGESVPYLDLACMLPLPLESAAFTWTAIRERKYAIVHNDMLWTFSFAADANDYEKYDPIFQHLMDTFFFK